MTTSTSTSDFGAGLPQGLNGGPGWVEALNAASGAFPAASQAEAIARLAAAAVGALASGTTSLPALPTGAGLPVGAGSPPGLGDAAHGLGAAAPGFGGSAPAFADTVPGTQAEAPAGANAAPGDADAAPAGIALPGIALPYSSVDPTGFGIPGEAELRALLAPTQEGRGFVPAPAPAAGPTSAPVPGYYFVDPAHPPANAAATTGVPGRASEQPSAKPALAHAPYDVNLVRQDFPILQERVHGRPLVWLDNAATTQKPKSVIERLACYYEHENSNVHRGAHELAARATDAYEAAREKVRGFLNAGSADEIVFVRGATEGINLVAQSWGRANIGAGDEIVVSWLEHHANIVPWQQLAAEKGARLRVIPVDDDGQVLLDEYAKLLNERTKLVSITQVSNALGTITPAHQIVAMAHAAGALALVDGAQSVSHMRSDVRALDADWFVFSGHKVYAPTGIGVVYGKKALLDATPPWQGGGNMIRDVTFEHTEYQDAPTRFEAGTGNIADAVGLGAAIDYVSRIGIDAIGAYEHELLNYATAALREIRGLRIVGTAPEKAGVLSFVLDGFRTEDVGAALNREGIAVRSGHHCAQPILRRFGLEATVRPSFGLYNTCADIDALVAALGRLVGGRSGVVH